MEGCAEVGECVLNRDVWTKTFKRDSEERVLREELYFTCRDYNRQ